MECTRPSEMLSAMVQGHVAIAHRAVGAFNRGDWTSSVC
jgi:hypothetical protein